MSIVLSKIKSLSRLQKILIIVTFDVVLAFLCWLIFGPPLSVLYALNFDISLLSVILQNFKNFVIPCFATFIYFYISGFYRISMKFSDSRDLITRSVIGSIIFGLMWGIVYLFQYEIMRNSYYLAVIIKSLFLSYVFYASIQISRDIAKLVFYPNKTNHNGKPILIYGAGSSGIELYHAIKNDPQINVVGFFDKSKALSGSEINHINIYGKSSDIKKLLREYKNLEIYLAIPSLNLAERRKIISDLEKYKVAIRSIPSLHEIVANQKKMVEMQDLSIDDILPRKRVKNGNVSFFGSSVMITGAGGSIGSEIVRQVLKGNPMKIVLFELSELNLYSIQAEIDAIKVSRNIKTEVIGILGDVKNYKRVKDVLVNHKIDLIYHAAAYKHVPIVEYYENISEGIKNNIFGTKTVCDAAIECMVKKVVVISTDKAVRPSNIMGASKRLAEMFVQSSDKKSKITKFCMVRFGNVINSSGSVIPLFRKQIAMGGPVTITHKEVTRFFMTITEASSLVIQAGEFAEGGEVFILDMGEQIKIMDLAEKMIYLSGRNISLDNSSEGIEIKEVGLRPGEKLYEELLISGTELNTPNDKIFKSIENFPPDDVLNKVISNIEEYILSNNIDGIISIFDEIIEGFNENRKQLY